jgi:hypothetical protein
MSQHQVSLEWAGSGAVVVQDCSSSLQDVFAKRERAVSDVCVFCERLQQALLVAAKATTPCLASLEFWHLKIFYQHDGPELTPNPTRAVWVKNAKRRPQDRWNMSPACACAWKELQALLTLPKAETKCYEDTNDAYSNNPKPAVVLSLALYDAFEIKVSNTIACLRSVCNTLHEQVERCEQVVALASELSNGARKIDNLEWLFAAARSYTKLSTNLHFFLADTKLCSKTELLHLLTLNGMLLRFATAHHRDDFVVAKTAVSGCGRALCFVSSRLRADRRVVRVALKSCRLREDIVDSKLTDDFHIVSLMVYYQPHTLCRASERLRKNVAIVKRAVSFRLDALKYSLLDEQKTKQLILSVSSAAQHRLGQPLS